MQDYLDAKYGKHLPSVKEIPSYQVGSLVYVRNHDATEKGQNKYKGPMEIVEHISDNIVMLKDPQTDQLYVPNEVHIDDLKLKFGRTEYPETQYNMPEDEEVIDVENIGDIEEVEGAAGTEVQIEDDLPKAMQQQDQEKPTRPKRKTTAPRYYGQFDDNEDQDEDEGINSDEDDQEYRVKKILARRRGPNKKWEYLVQFTGYPPNEAMWLKEVALNAKALKEANKAPISKPRRK